MGRGNGEGLCGGGMGRGCEWGGGMGRGYVRRNGEGLWYHCFLGHKGHGDQLKYELLKGYNS